MAKLDHAVGLLVTGVLLLTAVGQEAQQKKTDDKQLPRVVTDNKNTLVKTHRDKLKVTASTFFEGWAPEKAIDGDVETSWFTATGDAAAKGTKPWIMITFPEDVTVSRVSIVGNREPQWFDGYT